MKILITGGCGFIASHVVEHFFRHTDWDIYTIDKLSYASKGFSRLKSSNIFYSPRFHIFTYDLENTLSSGITKELGEIDYIIHMAAETHVDNSIASPVPFIRNNVMSTVNILEYARTLPKLKKFFYFSTDEVFGSAPKGVDYKEWDRHRPTNPYSASKSAGEQIAISYENTFKIPVIIVNVMNAFGERQHVEKFIPKCIKMILNGETVQIHADKNCEEAGSRFYIHARNIADAVCFLLNKGEVGEKYNITGQKELDNLTLAKVIADHMQKELKYEMVDFHSDRPGHDLRYSLDGRKLLDMGWKIPVDFYQSLEKTIKWTLNNPEWLEE